MHNEELHKLYASPNIIRVIKSKRLRQVGHLARMAEMRNVYSILVGKAEINRIIGRLSHRWEYYIRMYLGEIG